MGQDFTSRSYPMRSGIIDNDSEEGHMEPGGEDIKSSVINAEHPVFGLNQTIKSLNSIRQLSNSLEPLLSGVTKIETINEMIKAAYTAKFPAELLMAAADITESFDKRTGMGDAKQIIEKLTEFANGMKSGKDPKNYEVFMAFALDGADKAKELIEKAASAPNEKSSPIGSKMDDIIFFKPRNGEAVPRTNKEVVQFFVKRMLNGADFFPHLPLGRNSNG